MDDGGGAAADRPGLPARAISIFGCGDYGSLFFLVFAFAGAVVGAGTLCSGVLCGGRYADADDGGERDHGGVVADLFFSVSHLRSDRAGVGVRYWDWDEPVGAGLVTALSQAHSAGGNAMGRTGQGGGDGGDCRSGQF